MSVWLSVWWLTSSRRENSMQQQQQELWLLLLHQVKLNQVEVLAKVAARLEHHLPCLTPCRQPLCQCKLMLLLLVVRASERVSCFTQTPFSLYSVLFDLNCKNLTSSTAPTGNFLQQLNIFSIINNGASNNNNNNSAG